MGFIITVVLYSIVSAAVIVLMMRETNRKISILHSENSTEILPYGFSKKTYGYVVLLAGISAVCGYIVLKRSVLFVGVIELYACYLAVLAAAVIDLKMRMIPNYISITLIVIRVIIFIYEVLYYESALEYMVSSVQGCLLCAFLLIAANRIVHGGIGGGDIKLLSGIGFLCGVYVVFSILLIALISCMILSFVLLALKKNQVKDSVPFGPFIYIGTTIVYLFTMY